jgi:hypothetical protein
MEKVAKVTENSLKSAAVLIPLYKEKLEKFETISLEQCLKVLQKHHIIAVSPAGLEVDYVRRSIPTEFFDAHFFQSAKSFSELQLTTEFYARFAGYKHILLYHLDSFVFTDELSDWCARDFDYIGAPWFEEDWPLDLVFRQSLSRWIRIRWYLGLDRGTLVGNGGFSLRKVATMLEVLTRFKDAAEKWPSNEDVFWAVAVPNLFPAFKVPSVETALKFAFESKLRKSYAATNGRLPFGCHDWWRRDIDFWRPFFKECGYDI